MAINLKSLSQEIKEFMEWSKQEQEILQTTLNSINDNLHEISTKLPDEKGKHWLPLVTENSLAEDRRMSTESENFDSSNTETCTNRTSTLIVFVNNCDDSKAINSHYFRKCDSSSENKLAESKDILSPSKTVVNREPDLVLHSILRKQHPNSENLKKNSDEGKKKIRLFKNSSFQSPSKKIKK